jgi:isoamylase
MSSETLAENQAREAFVGEGKNFGLVLGAHPETADTYNLVEDHSVFGPVYEAGFANTTSMGVEVTGTGCQYAVCVGEGATTADICLFDDEGRATTSWRLKEGEGGLRYGHIPDMAPGSRYGLRIDGEWNPAKKRFFNRSNLLLDPYARAIDGSLTLAPLSPDRQQHPAREIIDKHGNLTRNNEDSAPFVPRCVVVEGSPSSFDWEGDSPPGTPLNKTILYEVHLRGATRLHPGIPPNLRGTYAGLVHPAHIEHLKELGITAVSILPVQHFEHGLHLLEAGLTNYWGYDTSGFFAPHGPYSSSGQRGEQVKEFKNMVKELHRQGLEVILDVVYNHTIEGNELGPTLLFKGIDASRYYLFGPNGEYQNETGVGNTTNVEGADGDKEDDGALELILQSMRYWVTEMHVDGFRFDLATILSIRGGKVDVPNSKFIQAVNNDPVLSKVKLFPEPWHPADGGYALDQYAPPWAPWNDQFRNEVRAGVRKEGDIRKIARALAGWFNTSTSVNFVTAHDGPTLRDLVRGNITAGRTAMVLLGLSGGIPMVRDTDTLWGTQGGNDNPYDQDNETTWLDWDLDGTQLGFNRITRAVLNLRRREPVFARLANCTGTPVRGPGTERDIAWFKGTGERFIHDDEAWKHHKVLGMYASGIPADITAPTGNSFLLYANVGPHTHEVTLPTEEPYVGAYKEVLNTATGKVYPIGEGRVIEPRRLLLGAGAAVLLVRAST